MGRWGDGEMGRWGDGEMGRWGDGEIFIKGNYPDMILAIAMNGYLSMDLSN
ncbi:MAG: hypothetical protein F6J94_30665 [Moorea sp. SIO1F2]|uniref:hypothetical protein n=1 Tax=unclassified Moorena TaxID=2683338 RepID=UPI0013B64E34|nr:MULTISPECIES: hypothetical protein [unclassified Moorena]NEN95253.1 hypothetical protein [Moorena sp. SIO3I7]NEO06769.1 hypothetical protein [Moorena sp. SIO3I8]NET86084.1 hypothetical protein [Moorena sp. SIO1F2]